MQADANACVRSDCFNVSEKISLDGSFAHAKLLAVPIELKIICIFARKTKGVTRFENTQIYFFFCSFICLRTVDSRVLGLFK